MPEVRRERLLEIAGGLSGRRLAVLGDYCADVFVHGVPCRLSREAPVPILRWEGEAVVPGSAGNVVRNLAALDARVTAIGAVGVDRAGRKLHEQLKQAGSDVSALVASPDVHTSSKTRIMAGGPNRPKQQLVRMDREDEAPLPEDIAGELLGAAEARIDELDGIVISDYGRGTVTEKVVESSARWAKDVVVVVDSRFQLHRFRGVTGATPNRAEFDACAQTLGAEGKSLVAAGDEVRCRLDVDGLLITRGNEGMTLCREGRPAVSIPVVGRDDVIDVTGAGDTVAAVFALALAGGADFLEAAHMANHAAGVVVTRARTATCPPEMLTRSLRLHGENDRENQSPGHEHG